MPRFDTSKGSIGYLDHAMQWKQGLSEPHQGIGGMYIAQ